MKILPINNYTDNKNTTFKSANKFCRYSIGSLIAGSSLFMLSNAIDSCKPEKIDRETTGILNKAASMLAIAGTAIGLFGIEKTDEKDENR